MQNFTKELFLFEGQDNRQCEIEEQKVKSCLSQIIALVSAK